MRWLAQSRELEDSKQTLTFQTNVISGWFLDGVNIHRNGWATSMYFKRKEQNFVVWVFVIPWNSGLKMHATVVAWFPVSGRPQRNSSEIKQRCEFVCVKMKCSKRKKSLIRRGALPFNPNSKNLIRGKNSHGDRSIVLYRPRRRLEVQWKQVCSKSSP